jgi:hypothetical protein
MMKDANRVSELLGTPVVETIGESGNISLYAPALKRSICITGGQPFSPERLARNWAGSLREMWNAEVARGVLPAEQELLARLPE